MDSSRPKEPCIRWGIRISPSHYIEETDAGLDRPLYLRNRSVYGFLDISGINLVALLYSFWLFNIHFLGYHTLLAYCKCDRGNGLCKSSTVISVEVR